MLKKILIAVAALIIIIGIGINFLWSNLDGIIRTAVEKYGTAATRAAVHLDSVNLSVTTGEGGIGGFSVGSPPGFSAAKSLYLGSVKVAVDTGSITGTGPIVIKSVVIDKPQITYEVNTSGDSNLQTIARNAQAYAASLANKAEASGDNSKKEPAATSGSQPGRKLIITDLVISNGQMGVSQDIMPGKQLSAGLPDIHLTNIGKASGGATAAEVAKQLLDAITASASKVATQQLMSQLNSQVGDQIKSKLGGKLGDVPGGSALKGLLGQ